MTRAGLCRIFRPLGLVVGQHHLESVCTAAAIEHLRRHPFTGSLRFAFELEIPDLRSWRLKRFPYLVFYVADDELIDIWRVLHLRRDIPAHLTDEPSI